MTSITHGNIAMSSFDDYVPRVIKTLFEVFKPADSKKVPGTPTKTYKIPEPPQDLIQKTRWVKPDETVTVNGIKITGVGFYLGSDLKHNNGSAEPSLVNPLMRASSTIDDASYTLEPTYMRFTPYQRHKYLEWLGSSCTTKAPNAFVYLYFYGLERRALIDGQSELSVLQEVRPLIEQLGNRYGVISVYTEPLLLHIDTLIADYTVPENLTIANYEYVAGRYVADKKPVPTDVVCNLILKSNVVRKSKYLTLFENTVEKAVKHLYGNTITLERCFSFKTVEYKALSTGLRAIPFMHTSKAVDVLSSRANVNKLQEIATKVSDSLDDYTKYLSKNPTHQNTLEANLMLPVYLFPPTLDITLKNLKYETDGYHLVDLPLETLLSTLNSDGTITKDKYARIVTALEAYKIGIYPASFKTGVDAKTNIILYSTDSTVPPETADLPVAELFIDIIAWASAKDYHFEDSNLFEHITKFNIGPNECKQLAACAKFKCLNNKNITGLKQKLKELPETARKQIADAFVSLSKSSDNLEPAEIKVLESIYKLLDIDQTSLYAALHSDSLNAADSSAATTHVLDMSKIKALQKETSEVASLLHSVFNSEEDIPVQEKETARVIDTTQATTTKTYLGLSVQASALLDIVKTKTVWKKEELKLHADELELMIDGVIDQINEACFDEYDESLIDGDDVLEININIIEKIIS